MNIAVIFLYRFLVCYTDRMNLNNNDIKIQFGTSKMSELYLYALHNYNMYGDNLSKNTFNSKRYKQ